jgi:O-acetyl-ADP-ribose deacetylase (regulator of RNase III)
MPRDSGRKCFVIMPFGGKPDVDGTIVDFNTFYDEVIRKAVEELDYEPVRSDRIPRSGSIHEDMFTHIAADELAIADITTLNPNVFYELGIRHALRNSITILLQKRGTSTPFNIHGLRVIEYSGAPNEYQTTRESIKRFVRAGLDSHSPDSPITDAHRALARDARPIDSLEERWFRLATRREKRICLITGDIVHRHNIDVWVNSENTNMQMARYYERSLSAVIRYGGAEKDRSGHVVDDVIARQLRLLKGDREWSVEPGTVWVTDSGSLQATNGVKRIFHAAAVRGVVGGGYEVVPNVWQCVTNSLQRLDEERREDDSLRTILFPMMGTGAGGGDVTKIAPRLIQAAIAHFVSHRDCGIQAVYFSVWTQRDLNVCLAALRRSGEVEPIAG